MILQDFKVFPRVGRIIGVDWGARRTGVAVSDESHEFVFTRPVILTRAGESVAPKIADIARVENAVGIVVGLPLRSDGTPSETTNAVRQMVDELNKLTDLPICWVEEILTSIIAQEQMGRVRRDDIKQKLDSESARVILENAIAIIRRIDV